MTASAHYRETPIGSHVGGMLLKSQQVSHCSEKVQLLAEKALSIKDYGITIKNKLLISFLHFG